MAGYLISEAARLTDVEAHVLRYWEEELELEIPRNELGHRYYTEENIEVFNRIKEMKAQGLQLKAIKENLAHMAQQKRQEKESETAAQTADPSAGQETVRSVTVVETDKPLPAAREDRMVEFESIIYDIVTEALRNNNERLGRDVSDRVNDKVVKELNYLMRENEDQMEEHFRKLDEALASRRRKNKGIKEAAATRTAKLPVVSQSRKKRRLFARKRKTTIY